METIPQKSNGIIENLIAGFFFFSPNLLMLWSFIRNHALWVFLIYDYVIIFTLISVMSHFRFNIRYTKNDEPDQSYSQSGKILKAIGKSVIKASKSKTRK